MGHSRPRKI